MHVEAAAGLPRHGATETFFSEFFPTAHGLLKGRPALWGLLQPAWLAERCPEQALVLAPGLALRNPELLPWQLLGVAVAAWGLARLRQRRFTYLRHSLLFFAGMNLRCAPPAAF